jgi:hypothetical protein
MRLTPTLGLLAAGSLLLTGQAEAKPHHRALARTPARIAHPPAHHMSALAGEQARQRRLRERDRNVVFADKREGVRFGAFKRDYSLPVYRPSVRPDQDGAVGFTWRMKTHD